VSSGAALALRQSLPVELQGLPASLCHVQCHDVSPRVVVLALTHVAPRTNRHICVGGAGASQWPEMQREGRHFQVRGACLSVRLPVRLSMHETFSGAWGLSVRPPVCLFVCHCMRPSAVWSDASACLVHPFCCGNALVLTALTGPRPALESCCGRLRRGSSQFGGACETSGVSVCQRVQQPACLPLFVAPSRSTLSSADR
jgi:hypothetical protein